jgi:two-component system nitrate/nitrite response regulator NarL
MTMEKGAALKLALLEPARLVREGLGEALSSRGYAVLGAASEGELMEHVRTQEPELCLVTVRSSFDGGELVRELIEWHPDTRVLVIGYSEDPEEAQRYHELGVHGFVDPSMGINELISGMRAVLEGSRCFPVTARALDRRLPVPGPLLRLTMRERQVLGYLALGDDNLKIAAMLGLSERTVRAHVSGLYRKLGSENRAQLALLARRYGVRAEPPASAAAELSR